ncbi:hypothetical protein P8452_62404 [Trifolium repens]|nr:hypothetical protein P8452_62404 [Trifolium repens]
MAGEEEEDRGNNNEEDETVVKADDDVADSSVQVAVAPVSGGKSKTTAEGASSVVASRNSDRRRKSTVAAMEAAKLKENRGGGGGGRKRKKNSSSDEEENAGDFMKKEKNKAGGSRKRKEIDENIENEMAFLDIKGYALRKTSCSKIKHNNTTHKVDPKIKKKNRAKWIEEESLMCHQCQRNDKGKVVRCKKCKRKRFCVSCINNWYPHLEEDDIVEACPVCCGNCNCKTCLQSTKLIDAIKKKKATDKGHEVELSKYMLKNLLPHLIRLDQEQMDQEQMATDKGSHSLN